MNFFIFSLPRSGSAWLATFLTYDGCFCYHEPLAEAESLDILFRRPSSGAVDTLAYTRPELRLKYRCFVLKRSIAEIEASSRDCGVNYAAPIGEFESATRGLPVIDYHQFADIGYLHSVWDMIVGTAFDQSRAMQLISMNIQRDLVRFKQKAPHLANFPTPSDLRRSRYSG